MNCLRKIISLILFGVVFINAQGGTTRDSWNYWHGNVQSHQQSVTIGGATTTYAFEYDGAGRLKNTARLYGGNVNNAYTERNLTYDRNGNILSLKRYGTSSSAPADNFSYTYAGNRLSQLNGSSYAYDDNGNMTADGRQGLEMEYNVLNLPRRIEDAQTGVGVSYSYLADGTKAEMRRDDGTGLAYAGDMVFTWSANGAYTFDTAAYCNGRLLANGTTQKFVTDHLGSVRAVVTGGQVVERNDYYPLGMRHPNPSYAQLTANRYGYNGKERQSIATSGTYLDYGARFLDPVLGRWTTTDPMAEKYPGLTPYNFCGNDPVNYVDLDGMEKIIYFKHSDLTHVRNYKELSFLAKQNKDNTKLMSSAVAAKDYTNIVSIYAHGSSKSLALTEHSFDNPRKIKQYLLDKSELYRSNSKSNRISIFVLHSCETGSGASSIAEQMSKVMTNCIIIAPDKRICNDDTFSKRGNWLIFSEGRITGTIKGKPKALGNALNKIDSDIESFVSKYENSNK